MKSEEKVDTPVTAGTSDETNPASDATAEEGERSADADDAETKDPKKETSTSKDTPLGRLWDKICEHKGATAAGVATVVGVGGLAYAKSKKSNDSYLPSAKTSGYIGAGLAVLGAGLYYFRSYLPWFSTAEAASESSSSESEESSSEAQTSSPVKRATKILSKKIKNAPTSSPLKLFAVIGCVVLAVLVLLYCAFSSGDNTPEEQERDLEAQC